MHGQEDKRPNGSSPLRQRRPVVIDTNADPQRPSAPSPAGLGLGQPAEPPTRMLQPGRTSTASANTSAPFSGLAKNVPRSSAPCGRWAARDQPERFVKRVRSFIEADHETHTTDDVHAELTDLCSKWR